MMRKIGFIDIHPRDVHFSPVPPSQGVEWQANDNTLIYIFSNYSAPPQFIYLSLPHLFLKSQAFF